MTTTIRIKRRTSGSAGAPSALKSGELAYNNVDGYLYVGYGDDGSGNATSVKPFAKDGFNAASRVIPGGNSGQVLTKNSNNDYDFSWATITQGVSYTAGTGLNLNGSNQFSVDFTTVAALASPALTGNPTAPTQSAGDSSTKLATTAFVATSFLTTASASSTYLTQSNATSTYAPLASPALTGTPTAPTASAGTNTTQIATTAFVASGLSSYAPLASPALTGTPTAPTASAGTTTAQIATTAFVASAVGASQQGLNPKQAVRAIATTNVSSLSGTQTIDGVSLAANDRVLLTAQSTASQNGIYVVASGSWARSSDMSTASQFSGSYVLATNGTSYAGHGFVNTNDPDSTITVGTTAITFVEFTGATDITAGFGIAKTGNTLAVSYTTGLKANGNALTVDLTVVAPLASPAFTGNPTAPTQAVTDNSTNIATTAYVVAYVAQATLDGGTF